MKTHITIIIIYIALLAVVIIGEVKCIIKAVNCNWEPVGKAEIIYTAASLTGFGAIVGYMDIQDN
jgi:hypothetical protein